MMKKIVKYCLLVVAVSTNFLPNEGRANSVDDLINNIAKGCRFNIQTKSKNEYVSVGDDGNILRWEKTGKNAQKWIVYPVDPSMPSDKSEVMESLKYRIMTVSNGEFMSVGSNGSIIRWTKAGDDTQTFRFVDPNGDYLKIKEPTKSEFVSVGWTGSIQRWSNTNNDYQLFKFEPIECIGSTTPYFLDDKVAEIEKIGPPPITNINGPGPVGTESERIKIGWERISYLLVDDPLYTNKISQGKNEEWYTLERWRYWKADNIIPIGLSEKTVEITYYIGMSQSSLDELKKTVSQGFTGKLEVEGKDKVASAKGSLEYAYKQENIERTESKQDQQEWRTRKVTEKFPKTDKQAVIVTWVLYDEYSLLGDNGKKKIWQNPVLAVVANVAPQVVIYPPLQEFNTPLQNMINQMGNQTKPIP
ncbi:MAG: hypothetical protein Q7T85_12350 [Nitrosomonas sp.]|nr:hypothetical protein [Nitrosomonas sp.]